MNALLLAGAMPASVDVLPYLLLLLGVALVFSAVGFYRVVYFVSVGYAFSIVAMAVVAGLVLRQNLTWAAAWQNAVLVIWGLRLGIYILGRESKSAYRRELESVRQRGTGVTGPRLAFVWLSVSGLYVLMFSPSLFNLATSPAGRPAWAAVAQGAGLAVMTAGLALEALADRQKSEFKARHPEDFCAVGLYGWVRCPNYLGEILVWSGNFIIGLSVYTSPVRWLAGLIGLVCIVLIMIGSTKRHEKTQAERYGHRPDYQTYSRTVPVLFPFVPVYSLQKIRVFIE